MPAKTAGMRPLNHALAQKPRYTAQVGCSGNSYSPLKPSIEKEIGVAGTRSLTVQSERQITAYMFHASLLAKSSARGW